MKHLMLRTIAMSQASVVIVQFDNNIYGKLTDISEIGLDVSNVHNNSLQLYEDATSSTEIKDHSILYIDGLFQLDSRTSNSNSDQYYPYPDICNSFEWNGLIHRIQ